MSLKFQPSFASGELDPALHERTNFDKYKAGLATARNTIVGKTGRIMTRQSRKLFVECKTDGREVRLHTMPQLGVIIEWGHLYVRAYRYLDGEYLGEAAHAFTEDNLPNLQFVNIDYYNVMVLLEGTTSLVFTMQTGAPAFIGLFFGVPSPPVLLSIVPNGVSGYLVDYAFSLVLKGEESTASYATVGPYNLPVALGQWNTINVYAADDVSSVKIFRRPAGGGAFGYIGETTVVSNISPYLATFIDHGFPADYTNQPIELTDDARWGSQNLKSKSGMTYQGRLLLDYNSPTENVSVQATRPKFKNNFYRDFPLQSDSALSVTMADYRGRILFMVEFDGAILFTETGIWLHTGIMSHTNFGFEKKGNWVIDENVPPLVVPGGVLFVDVKTNTVRQLRWSREANVFAGDEVSVFSDHLFKDKRIKTWAYQDGETPLVIVVFKDGTMAHFTYEPNHEMRAWTRGDSYSVTSGVASMLEIEDATSVTVGYDEYHPVTTGLTLEPQVFFVTKVGTTRYIEMNVPRYVNPETVLSDPESDKNESHALLDSMVSFKHLINEDATTAGNSLTLSVMAPTFADGDVTTGTDNINTTDHGFIDLMPVTLTTTGVLPTGLALSTTYYVIYVDADNYKLASSLENAKAATAVDITAAAGGGTHTATGDWSGSLNLVSSTDPLFKSNTATTPSTFVDANVTTGTDNINVASHNLSNLEKVRFTTTGALPAGLSTGTDYWVIYVDANNIKVAASLAEATRGNPLDITAAAGGGTHTITPQVVMGEIGTVFKYFDSDKAEYELTVETYVSDTAVTVSPNIEFPSADAADPRLYEAKNTFDGLDHMEGEEVSVLADGYIMASPLNTQVIYDTLTVSGGSINLPDSLNAALVHIGRPVISDVETLDIDTVEQSPVLIESMTIDKMYVKVQNTRGFFLCTKFPSDNTLTYADNTKTYMVNVGELASRDVDYEQTNPIIGNTYDQPFSKRVEVTLPGEWRTQGRICVRNVDPVHFEILSFLPDLEVFRRFNREV